MLCLGACASSTEDAQTIAAPSESDFRAECLQDYICSAAAKSPAQSELKNLSDGAVGKCSGPVEEKIRGHYCAGMGDDLVARDRDFTAQRAMTLAASWDDICR